MTMAAAIESRKAGTPAWSQSSRIAAIELFTDLDGAEAIWRSLESQQHLSTPYQRFDFLRPWQTMVGTREGLRPLVVVAYDRDQVPLLLLPLVLQQSRGVCVQLRDERIRGAFQHSLKGTRRFRHIGRDRHAGDVSIAL